VVFLADKQPWGAVVEVSGKQAGKPLTVRLQRCGAAKARFLDGEGKPLVGHRPHIEMVFAPGPHQFDGPSAMKGLLLSDAAHLGNLYRQGDQWERRTDREGRITLPLLIPGVRYRLVWIERARILREFTVRPGEVLDLKDIQEGGGK
jgi:hypothetical protein